MQINKQEFLESLKAIKPAISGNSILEHSDHFVFTPDYIRSYNDQIAIQKQIKTGLEGAVKASEFYALIDKMQGEEIELNQEAGQFIIKAGKTKAVVNIEEARSIPMIDTNKFTGWIKLPSDFTEAVSFSLFSAGKDMTKPIFTNLNIKGDVIISSDRFRITRYQMEGKIKKAILLPAEAAKFLVQYNPESYIIEDGWLHFTNKDNIYFSCRTKTGDYPAVDSFFDIEGEEIILPDILKDTIERVKILAQTEFEQDLKIRMEFKRGVIFCKGEGSLGYIEESVKTKYMGSPITIFINPIFLQDILKKLKTVIIGERALLFKGDKFEHAISLVIG